MALVDRGEQLSTGVTDSVNRDWSIIGSYRLKNLL